MEDKEEEINKEKKCIICSYSKTSIFNLMHYELKKNYILCDICNNLFHIKLKKAFLNMTKELNINIIDTYTDTQWKKIFTIITKKYNDSSDILDKINVLINKIFNDTNEEIQYKKPFNQCIIYNYKGEFYGYTTLKQMKHSLKLNKAIQISDNEIKWNFPVKNIENNYIFNYSRNKENKCIKCNNNEFLDTFSIIPKEKLKEFEGEGINIHFYYALCSKCKDKCFIVKELCNTNFTNKNSKNVCKYINELIDNKDKLKLNELIISYNEYYRKELELI